MPCCSLREAKLNEELCEQFSKNKDLLKCISRLEDENNSLKEALALSSQRLEQTNETMTWQLEIIDKLKNAAKEWEDRSGCLENRERELQQLHDCLDSEIKCLVNERTDIINGWNSTKLEIETANNRLELSEYMNSRLLEMNSKFERELQTFQSRVTII